jgi:hypothetical protein
MSWWYVGSTAVSLFVASDQANNAEHAADEAAAGQTTANDAALTQQQNQFEASQRLQAQLAGQQMAMQRGIANQQIAEARRQFAAVQQVLQPFITAGNEALAPLQAIQATGQEAMQGQRALIGLDGADAQGQAIQGLQNSPEMAAYVQQGENAMLQNASATGGLRGGNTQAAMAQFRPQLLAGLISQQYDRLGGLSSLGANTSSMLYQTGQSAAAGVGSAGMQVAGQVGSALAGYSQGVGQAIGNQAQGTMTNTGMMSGAYRDYYNNQGSIAAGNALAQGQASANFSNQVAGAFGSFAALQAARGSSNPSLAALGGNSAYSLGGSGGNGGLGLRATTF